MSDPRIEQLELRSEQLRRQIARAEVTVGAAEAYLLVNQTVVDRLAAKMTQFEEISQHQIMLLGAPWSLEDPLPSLGTRTTNSFRQSHSVEGITVPSSDLSAMALNALPTLFTRELYATQVALTQLAAIEPESVDEKAVTKFVLQCDLEGDAFRDAISKQFCTTPRGFDEALLVCASTRTLSEQRAGAEDIARRHDDFVNFIPDIAHAIQQGINDFVARLEPNPFDQTPAALEL